MYILAWEYNYCPIEIFIAHDFVELIKVLEHITKPGLFDDVRDIESVFEILYDYIEYDASSLTIVNFSGDILFEAA